MNVSIPFQRESLFRHVIPRNEAVLSEFPFPSNGKALSDEMRRYDTGIRYCCFNSLPTGKPFQTDYSGRRTTIRRVVSIPFQRESPFRPDYVLEIRKLKLTCFHSLPMGKPFQTSFIEVRWGLHRREIEFQFPSNGKALSDLLRLILI